MSPGVPNCLNRARRSAVVFAPICQGVAHKDALAASETTTYRSRSLSHVSSPRPKLPANQAATKRSSFCKVEVICSSKTVRAWTYCTDPMRLDTNCVVVSSYRVDLTAPASIGFQTRLE